MPKLSEKKAQFLVAHNKSVRQMYLRQLSAHNLDSLISYYHKKLGITLYKNGITPLGQTHIERRRAKIQSEFDKKIADLNEPTSKYYHAIVAFGFLAEDRFALCAANIGQDNYQHLVKVLKAYLDGDHLCTKVNVLLIHQIISNDSIASKILDEAITKYTKHWTSKTKERLQDCCVSQDEAWQEIKTIQTTLKENTAVGYVYTNGSSIKPKHFEVMLITKDKIIKPISWYNFPTHSLWGDATTFNPPLDECYQLDLTSILILKGSQILPSAQSDFVSCATLGLKYLKELLKEDGAQLKEDTLTFPFYGKTGQLLKFFFPSPQVLRYSQSNTYNQLIFCMLKDSEAVQQCIIKEKTFELTTLKGLLIRSIKVAETKGDEAVTRNNVHLLENLGEFRKKWNFAYQKMQEQRIYMNDVRGDNQYLVYAQQRMIHHATFFSSELKLPEYKLDKSLQKF